ncbi:MAG: hypothetical protein ACK5O7_02290 [Holosporales bacterium]
MIDKLPLIFRDKCFYICTMGLMFTGMAFFPGFMSPDSLAQYASSQSLVFDDWHPPIMSWVWSLLNFYFKGPEGLLYFHLALLWGAIFIWNFSYRENKLSWMIFLLPILPWVINFSGVLWKDVGMAFSLLLFSSFALLRRTPLRTFSALLILFYAINLRHNSLLAALPMIILVLWRWTEGHSKIKVLVISKLLLVSLFFLGNFFTYEVLKTSRTNPSFFIMIDDLSHLSMKNEKSLIPGIAYEDIEACSSQIIAETQLVGRHFCLSQKKSYQQNNPYENDLKKTWIRAILAHPIDYLKFRISAFSFLMRSPAEHPIYIWHPGIDVNDKGLKQHRNGATLLIEWYVKKAVKRAPFLFKPYWWLWFSLVLLLTTFLFQKNPTIPITQALLSSSILYMLGYIPLTPMADFRYTYWSVLATSLATILFIIEIYRLKISKIKSNSKYKK